MDCLVKNYEWKKEKCDVINLICCILIALTAKFNAFYAFCSEFCENFAFKRAYEFKPWYGVSKPQYYFQIVLDPLKGVHNIIFICIICLCKDFAYSTRSKMTKNSRSGCQNSPILGVLFFTPIFIQKGY